MRWKENQLEAKVGLHEQKLSVSATAWAPKSKAENLITLARSKSRFHHN